MNQPLLTFAGVDVTLGAACLALASAVLALLIAIAVLAARGSRRRLEDAGRQARLDEAVEARIGDLARIQAETAGRLQALGEGLGGRQAELARVVAERLDAVSTRIGHSMDETTRQSELRRPGRDE